MNRTFLLLALIAAACKTTGTSVPLIVGGEPVPTDHPLHDLLVVISHQGKFRCSGVLVDATTVATAAHCVRADKASDFAVHTGETLSGSTPIPVVRVLTAIPWSQNSGPRHDVAWLEIKDPQAAKFLPVLQDPADLLRAEEFVVGGYGRTSSVKTDYGTRLIVKITINHVKDGPLFRHILITGPNPGRGTCDGDSGGPGIVRVAGKWFLATVVFGAPDEFFADTACEAGQDAQTLIAPYIAQMQIDFGRQKPLPQPPPLSYNNWQDWCRNWAKLGLDSGLTVSHLLAAAGESDCDAAEAKLAAMTHLNLADRQIADIRPLTHLKNLVALDVSYNRVKDGAPLGSLEKLRILNIQQNANIDLKAVRKLSSLQRILAHNVGAKSFSFLGENVEEVIASCNSIAAIDQQSLPATLRIADIRNNNVSDLSPILALPKIEIVQATGNPLTPDPSKRIVIFGPSERSCAERWRFNSLYTVFNR